MSVSVKICGITNMKDAEAAVQSGATFIGLIFIPETPRCITPHVARGIAERVKGRARLVGVFRDQSLNEIEMITKAVSLDLVQLHGTESPLFCKKVALPVIKSFSPNFEGDNENCSGASISAGEKEPLQSVERFLKEVQSYRSFCQHVLIDRRKTVADASWLAVTLSRLKDIEDQLGSYFFAGGLNLEELTRVLDSINPFALDVSSGVEAHPGNKDHVLMNQFCDRAKSTKSDGTVVDQEGRQNANSG